MITREARQYWFVRLATVFFGLVLVVVAAAWSVVRAGHIFWHARSSCSCLPSPHHVAWTTDAALLAVVGASLLLLIRFSWAFWKHRQRSRTTIASLQLQKVRFCRHEPSGEVLMVVDDDRPQAMTLGLWRARVYLTTGLLTGLTKSEVTSVIRHEQAHRLGHDPLWSAVLASIATGWGRLSWFSAWVKASYSLRELQADAKATRNYADTKGLAGAMYKVASRPLTGVGVAFSPNNDRVEKLLDHTWRPAWRLWHWPQLLGVVVVCFVVVLALRIGRAEAAPTPMAGSCHRPAAICPGQTLISPEAGRSCQGSLAGSCSTHGTSGR